MAALLLAGCGGGGTDTVPVVPGRIAFQSSRIATGTMHVFIMDDDGTNARQLAGGAAGDDQTPALSPDGAKVAFSSNRSGHYGVYVVNADNTGLVPILVDSYENLQPSWSPDGARLVFVRANNTCCPPGTGISIINVTGTGLTPLTTVAGDAEAAWSPDGNRVAFTRAGDVWVINANGTSPVQLTTNVASEGQALWLPGGTTIGFTSAVTGQQQLLKMSAIDGSGVTPLIASASLPAAEATLSPDGAWVAYVGARNGSQQILKRKADGTGSELSIAAVGAYNSHPSWRAHP